MQRIRVILLLGAAARDLHNQHHLIEKTSKGRRRSHFDFVVIHHLTAHLVWYSHLGI